MSRLNLPQHFLSSSSSSDDSEPDLCDRMAIVPYRAGTGKDMSWLSWPHGFGLGPRNYSEPNSEGWSHRRSRGKAKKEYTDKQIKQFGQIYMDEVKALTGFEMQNFQLTRSTQKYVSMFDFARARDRVLATLFERRPSVWDLHAGSGADSLAFLGDLDPREVVMCQRSVPDGVTGARFEESMREYKVMCSNIRDFVRAAGIDALISVEGESQAASSARHHVHVKCKHKLAETFIMSVPDGTEVDIVHLDPSWDDDHDIGGKVMYGREMRPNELFARLEQLIWKPIKRKGIKVGCYVIKTRWNLLKVEEYLSAVNSEFIATYSVRAKPFRPNLDGMKVDTYEGSKGAYYYMVLTHREYKTIDVVPSQMYWDIVRNGQPVWVKKDTCVGLIQPVYSNHKQYPEWTETDPKSVEYMMIQPHSRASRGASRIVGPHDPQENTTYDPRKFHEGHVEDGGQASSDDSSEPEKFASRNPYDELDSD